MVAAENKLEALRMAAGLTLLDDKVSIVTLGKLADSAEFQEQLDALEFMEVPVQQLDHGAGIYSEVASMLMESDVVFCV